MALIGLHHKTLLDPLKIFCQDPLFQAAQKELKDFWFSKLWPHPCSSSKHVTMKLKGKASSANPCRKSSRTEGKAPGEEAFGSQKNPMARPSPTLLAAQGGEPWAFLSLLKCWRRLLEIPVGL
jgi:hypothetical protein